MVMTDRNREMLQKAVEKFQRNHRNKFGEMSFMVQNVEGLQFEDESFDHVVDTFGLCSCDDPVAALKEMARVTKKDGTVRLLEHGRGSYQWLNEFLDKSAEDRSRHWGCWWNRDVIDLVRSAGLEIVEERLFHFGTTQYIIARKK